MPDTGLDLSSPTNISRMQMKNVTLGYDKAPIISDLSTAIPAGSFTVIIGPNACGKSTLLRGLSRLLSPASGQVILDGKDISTLASK